MNDIRTRIQLRLDELGIGATAAAVRAGFKPDTIRSVIQGKSRNPKADTLERIAKALGMDPYELAFGQKPAAVPAVGEGTSAIRDAIVWVPEHGASAGAGGRATRWAFPAEWLRHELRGTSTGVLMFTIDGDSMTPTLAPGDRVLVDTARTDLSASGLFMLQEGQAAVPRRLELIDGDPARVRVSADNPRHGSGERLTANVHVVGRIMARWERLG